MVAKFRIDYPHSTNFSPRHFISPLTEATEGSSEVEAKGTVEEDEEEDEDEKGPVIERGFSSQ